MGQTYSLEIVDVDKLRSELRSLDLKVPVSDSPVVSIVIPVHNQFEYTVRSVVAVCKNTSGVAYEIVVVDDGSSLEVFLALQSVQGLRIIRNFKNLGFLHSCNRGVANARGEFVVLLNNDTEVGPNWLPPMLNLFAVRPDCGLVGSKLVYPDGTLQEAGGIVWADGSAWNYGRNQDPSRPEFNYVRETDYCSGACIMFPRELFRSIGGFDPRFAPAYYEDVDLAFKIRSLDKAVLYQPASVVVHYEGKSSGTDTNAGVKQFQVVNQVKMIAKWYPTLVHDHRPNGRDVFLARERSLRRKVILFIDHYIPRFDCDAGSRSIFAYIKFFAAQGFSIKFIGDNFYPDEPYQSILQQLGVEVLSGAWYAANWEAWLEANGTYLDYVFLSRANIAKRYLPAMRRTSKAKLLFLGVDLISRTARNEFLRTGHSNKERESIEWAQHEKVVFDAVDVVYYPSPIEVDHLRNIYPQLRARVLPLCVFDENVAAGRGSVSNRKGLLFVGGFRHPPNIGAVVWFCREVMPILRRHLPGLVLTIAGSHPSPEIEGLSCQDVEVTGYVTDERLCELYDQRRVAIVPLLDGGGIKGKVLEALWRGIPLVTTPVGAEGVPEIESAAVIVEPSGIAEAVVSLYNDDSRLADLISAGSRLIKQHFSADALARVFAQDIELSSLK